jgi:hypothetical protein
MNARRTILTAAFRIQAAICARAANEHSVQGILLQVDRQKGPITVSCDAIPCCMDDENPAGGLPSTPVRPPRRPPPGNCALCEATGRPLGAPELVTGLENLLGRKIARRAPGRRPAIEFPEDYQLKLL